MIYLLPDWLAGLGWHRSALAEFVQEMEGLSPLWQQPRPEPAPGSLLLLTPPNDKSFLEKICLYLLNLFLFISFTFYLLLLYYSLLEELVIILHHVFPSE